METGDLGEFIYSIFVGNARLWRGEGGESEEGRGVGGEKREGVGRVKRREGWRWRREGVGRVKRGGGWKE